MLTQEELFGKCPYATAQKILSGKWALIILHYLSENKLRFTEGAAVVKMDNSFYWTFFYFLLDNSLVGDINTRGYCYYCPLGTVLGFVAKIADQKIIADNSKCVQCNQCNEACSMSTHISIKALTTAMTGIWG
jgi:ferredoxin-like protein FixX